MSSTMRRGIDRINLLRALGFLTTVLFMTAPVAAAEDLASQLYWQSQDGAVWEDHFAEPLPPGFQVVSTELDGPVFADAEGRTFYKWPQRDLRNGGTGDR
ncbi:MAG: hypothetical protein RIA65_16520 [Woeseia sp.]